MLKFFIILAAWITPGIVLFLYLLWISKRRERPQSAAAPVADLSIENDSSVLELSQEVAAAPTRRQARG